MPEKLFATFDRAHLRVYQRRAAAANSPSLELVEAVDFPAGRERYTEQEADQAGRFPRSRGTAGGMGIDERLPMMREHERRVAGAIAARLDHVLRTHPATRWQCAASPDFLHEVLDRLEPAMQERLEREIPKNLAHMPAEELRSHFLPA